MSSILKTCLQHLNACDLTMATDPFDTEWTECFFHRGWAFCIAEWQRFSSTSWCCSIRSARIPAPVSPRFAAVHNQVASVDAATSVSGGGQLAAGRFRHWRPAQGGHCLARRQSSGSGERLHYLLK